jgi:hypothetical protein
VEHLVGGRRRRLTPEIHNQAIARDELIGSQREKGQQNTLSPRSNRYFKAALANDLERAKQAEIQTVTTVTPGTGPS